MAWVLQTSQSVPTPRGTGWLGFTLPTTAGVVAWALVYEPVTPLQDNLARIGFFVPSVLVDGEVIAGVSKSMVSQPAGGSPFYQHFDYSFLNNYPGYVSRVSEYYVSFQPVAYIPSGLIALMALF
jgi:hypothetical protein